MMSENREKVPAGVAHRKVKSSTVSNRKMVRRPSVIDDEPKQQKVDNKTTKRVSHPANVRSTVSMKKVNERMVVRRGDFQRTKMKHQTSREIKESEIQKAIRKVSSSTYEHRGKKQMGFGMKRVALALVCAVIAVFVVVYFVNLNSPDIALKVAALQTGIDAVYPNFVPRNYKLSDITSENGKIVLNFRDQSSDNYFTLVEERSSWDSTALYNNYIIEVFGSNYTTVKEGGLTIYIGSDGAAWVNGGILYKLKFDIGLLTKKQVTSIATK